eukprot:3471308-Pyramimonas_sp.AAC.1
MLLNLRWQYWGGLRTVVSKTATLSFKLAGGGSSGLVFGVRRRGRQKSTVPLQFEAQRALPARPARMWQPLRGLPH